MLVRSMSPQVVAVDEIGSMEDVMAIKQIINCGCHILASIHGYGIADCMNRRELAGMFGANGFERIVVLSDKNGAGTIEEMRAVKMGDYNGYHKNYRCSSCSYVEFYAWNVLCCSK